MRTPCFLSRPSWEGLCSLFVGRGMRRGCVSLSLYLPLSHYPCWSETPTRATLGECVTGVDVVRVLCKWKHSPETLRQVNLLLLDLLYAEVALDVPFRLVKNLSAEAVVVVFSRGRRLVTTARTALSLSVSLSLTLFLSLSLSLARTAASAPSRRRVQPTGGRIRVNGLIADACVLAATHHWSHRHGQLHLHRVNSEHRTYCEPEVQADGSRGRNRLGRFLSGREVGRERVGRRAREDLEHRDRSRGGSLL